MPPKPRAPKPRAKGQPLVGARARKIWLIVGAALAVAVVLIGISIASGKDSKKPSGNNSAVISMLAGIPQDGAFLGKETAPVTMIDYIDQQCPYCEQYSTEALPTIIKQFVRSGQVRLQMMQFPFIGADSLKTARYVVAAESQGKAWQVSGLLYANQGEENGGWVTNELLDEVGGAIPGLDVAQWKRDAASKAVAKKVEASLAEGQAAGVSSTPSFFIVQPPKTPEAFEPSSLSPDAFTARLNEALGQ